MSQKPKYRVVLWPGEDGWWVVECPSLPGCISQGKTKQQALANIAEAIEGCLELRREEGMPIPEPDVEGAELAMVEVEA